MATLAETFSSACDLQGASDSILNAGSRLLLLMLAKDTYEPPVYTLTPLAAAALATSISVYISGTSPTVTTPSIVLRKGAVLTFGATKKVVVTADTVVTSVVVGTPDVVPVQPLASALLVTDLCTTWGLLQLLSPTDLPITDNDTTVDRTDLTYGLQGSMVKTSKEKTSQITIIARADDRAYWDHVYRASQCVENIFALFARTGPNYVWGPAKIMSLQDPGQIKEIRRPQFTLNFQAPYAAPTLETYLAPAELTALNTVKRLAAIA